MAWGGGETPALAGIVADGRVDLAASCTGIISPKSRLSLGDKLDAGDAIVLLASSGIHANGLSLARALADRLPDGYNTDYRRRTEVRRGPARAHGAVFARDRSPGCRAASRRTTAPTSPAMAGAS